MALAPGDKLGHYEIVAPIGAGGMGEVYRARDTRLGREVAIKISQERFSERFEREARAISALNHSKQLHALRRRTELPGHGVRRRRSSQGPSAARRSSADCEADCRSVR